MVANTHLLTCLSLVLCSSSRSFPPCCPRSGLGWEMRTVFLVWSKLGDMCIAEWGSLFRVIRSYGYDDEIEWHRLASE